GRCQSATARRRSREIERDASYVAKGGPRKAAPGPAATQGSPRPSCARARPPWCRGPPEGDQCRRRHCVRPPDPGQRPRARRPEASRQYVLHFDGERTPQKYRQTPCPQAQGRFLQTTANVWRSWEETCSPPVGLLWLSPWVLS